MFFSTLAVETATKNKFSVCRITIIDYENKNIICKKDWLVEPPNNEYSKENFVFGYTTLSPDDTKNKPNIFEIWSEIEDVLFNKTIISYDANYNFDCLIASFNYFRTKKLEEIKDNPVKENLPQNNLSCEFICLSLVIRRLFVNLLSHNLDKICNHLSCDINSDNATKIGYLFNILIKYLKITDFLDLKHKCGITIGQIFKYKTFYKAKNDTSFILNEYYPCLPLTENEIFRKYDYNKFVKGEAYD